MSKKSGEKMREKKKTELAVKTPEAMTKLLSKRGAKAVSVYKKTGAKIKKGLEKPTASTGTPISKLHGGPKFMAQLSNVGGGSVATGGGGIKEGFNTIAENVRSKETIRTELSRLALKGDSKE